MKKHIPYITAFLMQAGLLFQLSFVGILIIYQGFHGRTKMILLVIFFTLWLIDLILLLFSYFK